METFVVHYLTRSGKPCRFVVAAKDIAHAWSMMRHRAPTVSVNNYFIHHYVGFECFNFA
jgi:hypothetical protein